MTPIGYPIEGRQVNMGYVLLMQTADRLEVQRMFCLDMSQSTQHSGQSVLINQGMSPGDDFDDAMLMLGRTFSDYESDTHITPVMKGGTEPMEYIDVVVNVGTVGLGLARAPKFELNASNLNPFVNERVYITADPVDKNDSYSSYAYAWYCK